MWALSSIEWTLFLVGAGLFVVGGWVLTKTTYREGSPERYGFAAQPPTTSIGPSRLGCFVEILGALLLVIWLAVVFH